MKNKQFKFLPQVLILPFKVQWINQSEAFAYPCHHSCNTFHLCKSIISLFQPKYHQCFYSDNGYEPDPWLFYWGKGYFSYEYHIKKHSTHISPNDKALSPIFSIIDFRKT